MKWKVSISALFLMLFFVSAAYAHVPDGQRLYWHDDEAINYVGTGWEVIKAHPSHITPDDYYHATKDVGDYVEFSVYDATTVELVTTSYYTHGVIQVFVDGEWHYDINLYSGGNAKFDWHAPFPIPTRGIHHVKLVNRDPKHFEIDAFTTDGYIIPYDYGTITTPELSGVAYNNRVELTWTNSGSYATYNLYRDGVLIAVGLKVTSYLDQSVEKMTTYEYVVEAVHTYLGTSYFSDPIYMTPGSIIQPDPPKGLTAASGNRKVTLYWTANKELNLAGYHIYRDGVRITAAPIKGITYTDINLENGREYTYYIVAVDTSGNESDPSESVSVIPYNPIYVPPLDPPTGLTGTAGIQTVTLSWDGMGDGIGYFIYQNGQRVNFTPIYDTSIVLHNLPAGKYRYELVAINQNGIESKKTAPIWLEVMDYVPQLIGTAGNGEVRLTWKPVPGATEYMIYRDGVQIGTVTGTEYIDTGLENGEKYTYFVEVIIDGQEYRSEQLTLRPGEHIQFPSWLENILDVVGTAFSFLRKYTVYVLTLLGIILAPTIIAYVLWLWMKVRHPMGSNTMPEDRAETRGDERRTKATRLLPVERQPRGQLDRIERIRDVRESSRSVRSMRIMRAERSMRAARSQRDPRQGRAT